MSFSARMRQAMADRNINQKMLVDATGISKSGVSQYLSGKNIPLRKTAVKIAEALEVPVEWLFEQDNSPNFSGAKIPLNVPVQTAAKIMGVGAEFIRVGLQRGTLPFGYAIKINGNGNRYTYHISPKKFAEYTGYDFSAGNYEQGRDRNA